MAVFYSRILACAVMSAALLSVVACSEEQQEVEEVSELASCVIEAPNIGESVAPRALKRHESDPDPSACEDLNAHLASIAHIAGMLEVEIEEGGEP